MKHESKDKKLKTIQKYCNELSTTFARLSLELGELINEEDRSVASDTASLPTAPTQIEFDNVSNISVERPTKVDRTSEIKHIKKKQIHLFKQPTDKFQVGDIVKINNHYKGKFGDLYGREATVEKIGTSFVFIRVPGISVLQQRAESNLLFVSRKSIRKR